MTELTISMQHYIKAIFELSPANAGIRVSEIASKLNISKASVSVAMKTLEKKQMVFRDENRLVFLTPEGKAYAIQALDKAGIIRKFLTDVLGVKSVTAAIDACAMEHVISSETLCTLCQSINRKCSLACYVITDSKTK